MVHLYQKWKYNSEWDSYQRKALYFTKELKLEKFQASEGWLDNWKERFKDFGNTIFNLENLAEAKSIDVPKTVLHTIPLLNRLVSYRFETERMFLY